MKAIKQVTLLLTIGILFSSCALIVGGSNYNAMVDVNGGSNPSVYYKGKKIGTGGGVVKVPRREADKLVFAVKQDGCEEQQYNFSSRKFRGWAFVGSLLFWSYPAGGIPVPVGNGIDLVCGANWKPNDMEPGIQKLNYKNYRYELDYTGCKVDKKEEIKQSVQDKLNTLKELFDKGEITEEEYKKARAKALEL